jgi:hypothetical protein
MIGSLALVTIAFGACSGSNDTTSMNESTTIAEAQPSTFPPLPTSTIASIPEVLVVGDFLTTDTAGLGLEDAISRIGWIPTIDAAEDRLVAEGADRIEALGATGSLPRLIIVSLGSNDACLATPIESIETHIRRIAAFAGEDHLVVWVNLQMRDCMSRANALNVALAATAMNTPNFFIGDWATDAPIRRLEGDGIHYDRAGSQFRVDYYVSLLRLYAGR